MTEDEAEEIKKLSLPMRVKNILLDNNINFNDLKEMDAFDILSLRGIGMRSFRAILKVLIYDN